MTLFSLLATIFGTLASLGIFSQVYKIFKRKSAEDVSIITFFFLAIAALIWILYGIEIKSFPIIFANIIGLVNMLLVIIGWFIYREKH